MISIIIPYYDRPQKIHRCVNSVLAQSYQDFEILIIDDHSPEPLRSFADDRIKIFRNKNNRGPGLSRNVGLDHAKGDHIAFLDCDDYWHEDFLKESHDLIKREPNLAMVYSQVIEVDKNKNKLNYRRGQKFENKTILPDIFQKGRPWCTSSCLWNGALAREKGKWIEAKTWEDYVFDTSIAVHNNHIKGVKDALVYYDTTGDDKLSFSKRENILKQKTHSIKQILQLLDEIQKETPLHKECLSNIKFIALGLTAQSFDINNK